MKKTLFAIASVLALSACGSSAAASTADAVINLSEEHSVTFEPVQTPQTEEVSNPREHMEAYECMEIAFLGLTDENTTPQQVVENARQNFAGFSWLAAVSDENYVSGEQGDYLSVYVILPAEDTDLKIGQYSWYAGEITNVYYDEKNSGPVIFTETSEAVSPISQIEYTRHYADGEQSDAIYSGFSVANETLRTDYHMGTVDTTPYEQFTSAEVPFYRQYFFDTLTSLDEIKAELDSGASLSVMDEMIYDSYAYALYDLQREDGSHAGYAITPDQNAEYRIMYSPDYMSWSPMGQG